MSGSVRHKDRGIIAGPGFRSSKNLACKRPWKAEPFFCKQVRQFKIVLRKGKTSTQELCKSVVIEDNVRLKIVSGIFFFFSEAIIPRVLLSHLPSLSRM